jgi:hypothetical protein
VQTEWLYLRMHTVTVSVRPGIDGSVDISFQMNLRNKRDPALVWPPDRLPADYRLEPSVETCDRAEAIMDCDLRRCTCAPSPCPSVAALDNHLLTHTGATPCTPCTTTVCHVRMAERDGRQAECVDGRLAQPFPNDTRRRGQ